MSGSPDDPLGVYLARGYAAYLSVSKLCEAVLATIEAPRQANSTVLNRLAWQLADTTSVSEEVDNLALCLIESNWAGAANLRVEANLSHLYPHFSAPVRQRLLDRWYDKGTSMARRRWLKAIEVDPFLYADEAIVDCWFATRDVRAAKILAYKAPPATLVPLISDLVQEPTTEWWIVSKAVQRLGHVSDEVWEQVLKRFPATFAYLSATLDRGLSEADARKILDECSGGPDREYGVAIASIGKLGHKEILDEIWLSRSQVQP